MLRLDEAGPRPVAPDPASADQRLVVDRVVILSRVPGLSASQSCLSWPTGQGGLAQGTGCEAKNLTMPVMRCFTRRLVQHDVLSQRILEIWL